MWEGKKTGVTEDFKACTTASFQEWGQVVKVWED